MRDYERIVRQLIAQKNEAPKVDFKRTVDPDSKRDIAEIAKLSIAMANTDSDDQEDFGYIIFGASRGELVGGVDWLALDSRCASFVRSVNNYIHPEAFLELKTFLDDDKGWFGTLLIKPSIRQMRPHVVAKEFSDRTPVIRRNECFVRRGEAIELASRTDLERMFYQRFGLEYQVLLERDSPQPNPTVSWSQGTLRTDVLALPPRAEPAPVPITLLSEFPKPLRALLRGADVHAADAYDRSVREYNAELRQWAAQERERLGVHNNLIRLHVACRNDGRVPLLGPRWILRFPAAFSLYSENELPRSPRPPDKPRPPRIAGVADASSLLLDHYGSAVDAVDARRNLNWLSGLSPTRVEVDLGGMSRRDEHSAEGWSRKILHGFDEVAERPILLLAPVKEDIYEVNYEVHADNLFPPKKGTLRIKVDRHATRLDTKEA